MAQITSYSLEMGSLDNEDKNKIGIHIVSDRVWWLTVISARKIGVVREGIPLIASRCSGYL